MAHGLPRFGADVLGNAEASLNAEVSIARVLDAYRSRGSHLGCGQ